MIFKLLSGTTAAKEKRADESVSTRLIDGIDREMNYCPNCGDEYRGDIDDCALCGIELISGEQKITLAQRHMENLLQRSMEINPGDALVSIQKGPLKDIKSLQRVLAKQRIPSIIAGDENNCSRGCCGPEMFLQIRENDLESAQAVLAMDFMVTTAVDPQDLKYAELVFDQQAAETTCPACGCRFSPSVGACPECGLCFE
jgi:hypothetical protein